MSEKFEREERYIVFKVKDLSEHKLGWVRDVIRLNDIPTVNAVVVEADWPEYEPTWAAIERRVTGAPAWTGEGLPPVGTVCEYKRGSRWEKVEVFAVRPNVNGSTSALFTYECGAWTACAEPSFFRPIRTPEQIAAEERKAAIDAMSGEVGNANHEACSSWDVCEALYDLGYRKQVAP